MWNNYSHINCIFIIENKISKLKLSQQKIYKSNLIKKEGFSNEKTYFLSKVTTFVLCFILLTSTTTAFALTASSVSSKAIRNKISSSWSYKQRGYYENNCLAWALGNTTNWIWPWGQKNPTVAQVNTFMSSQGYRNTGNQNMSQKIYAFGKTSGVTHFSRGLGNGPLAVPMDAKWGHYEVFNHQSPNPYYSIASGSYGPRVASYTK